MGSIGLAALMIVATACPKNKKCEVDYTIQSSWNGGFVAEILVTNLRTKLAFDGWTLRFPATEGQNIEDIWGAEVVAQAGEVELGNVPDNARIEPGATTGLGFRASFSGEPVVPSSFKLNGHSCRIAGAAGSPTPAATSTPGVPATPTPAPTAPPTPAPTATPRPAAAAIQVSLTKSADWGLGYTADLVVANHGGTTVSGWVLEFDLTDTITSVWNGNLLASSPGHYRIQNAPWNGTIAPGASVAVGFNASVAAPPGAPTGCLFNAVACEFPGGPTPTPGGPSPSPTAAPTLTPAPTGSPTGPSPDKRIVGYFTSWSIYDRNYHVSDIPADKLTHINYAFVNVSADGRCTLGDPYADVEKFYEGDSWDAGALRGNFNQLQKLKQDHPHLATLLSVGGWTWSGRFSDAALTAQARATFAQSCVQFMLDYGFDGIDIDWEYPVGGGLPANTTRPEDKENFTLLLQELRAQLDAQESLDGGEYQLTIAAPAGPSAYAHYELDEIAHVVDWINLMAYDFHGAWESTTGLHAPLHAASDDPSPDPVVRTEFNVNAAVQAYLAAGVPNEQLVLGMGIYGRGWTGVPTSNAGLFQSATGAAPGTWEPGNYDYRDIVTNLLPNGYARHWHAGALAPWAYSPSAGILVTYDDPESIGHKTDYVNAHNLGGAMLWELSGDVRSGPASLVEATYLGLQSEPGATPTPGATSTPAPTASATPPPAPTATPNPTATPAPTPPSTPVPMATATPAPTPIPTPEPTPTPVPTPAGPTGEELFTLHSCHFCHGTEGSGTTAAPTLLNWTDEAALATKIDVDMPLGNPSACSGDCATKVAQYILNDLTDLPLPPINCSASTLRSQQLRLLTRREYAATIEDLLGLEATGALVNFPVEIRVQGYDNNSQVADVTSRHIDEYLAEAEDLALRAVAEKRSDIVTCDPSTGAIACARSVLESFGAQAYRRPITTAEVDRLTSFFSADPAQFDVGLHDALWAMLISPNFLYRSEVGTLGGDGDYHLDGWEIASSLSYLLWGTMPDAALFGAAADGTLDTTAGRRAQAERLLADPRARGQLGRFASQWLDADPLLAGEKDPSVFPTFNSQVQESQFGELQEFVSHVTFDSTGDFSELFDPGYVVADPVLAAYYGLPLPGGSGFSPIAVTDGSRGGLLTLGSVLSAHAHSDDGSPVRRGVFVRRRVLCQDLPPPPPDVDNTPPGLDPNLTTRERFTLHSSNATCQSCHQFIDGVGFGFEHFDGAGGRRETENGVPVDATGDLVGLEGLDQTSSIIPFDGTSELSSWIAGSDSAPRCLSLQLYRYAAGAEESAQDACEIDALAARFAQHDYDLRELLLTLIELPSFTARGGN
ncbi:MAG: glycosyl hydrolase family 18 protein [Candidatus Binatia bacterium]|nr:glycosyl hydrolase family 18 protein [Candidatus Binatia bacterium]